MSVQAPFKIVVHQLAWLPHYLPLYWSLSELDHVEAKVETYEGAAGLQMFRNAEHRSKSDGALHIVLAGHFDPEFDTAAGEAALEHFIYGAILIHRTPLWLYASSQQVFQRILNGEHKVSIIVPPEDSTLHAQLKLALDKAFPTLWNQTQRIPMSEVFSVSSAAELAGLLRQNTASLVASIFPLTRDSSELYRCNVRLPSDYAGFTALWVTANTVTDDAAFTIFRRLQRQINIKVHDLMGRDYNIFDGGVTQHSQIVARVSECYLSDNQKGHDFNAQSLRAKLGKLGLPSTERLDWIENVAPIIAELALSRVWDFSFIFDNSSKLAHDQRDRLHVKSLPSFLRERQLNSYRTKLKERLESVLRYNDLIQKVSGELGLLKRSIEGRASDQVDAVAGFEILSKRWSAAFKDAEHLPETAFIRRHQLCERLRQACSDEKPKPTEQDQKQAEPPAVAIERLVKFTRACELTPVPLRCATTIELLSRVDLQPEDITEKRLVYEAKAVSKGSVALSWLGTFPDDGLDPWKHRIDHTRLARESIGPFHPLVLISILERTPDFTDCALVGNNDWNLVITINQQSGKDLTQLVPVIYHRLSEVNPTGQTSTAIYDMRAMGFHLRIQSHDEKCLKFSMNLPHCPNA